MKEAIVFDFDGVLAESMNVKTEAFAKIFEKYGEDIVEKIVTHHIENGGISRYEKFMYYYRKHLGKELTKEELEKLANAFSQLVVLKVIQSPEVPGAKEFLEKNYETIDFFVASGTPQDELEKIIKQREMNKYFKGIYGSPKKKEHIIKTIIQNKKYCRDNVLFIGDSISDYIAAKKAKVPFIGRVTKETSFNKEVNKIKDLTELKKFI